MSDNKRPVGLHLPEDVIAAVDRAADHEGTNRAAWMRLAVIRRLQDEGWTRPARPASVERHAVEAALG